MVGRCVPGYTDCDTNNKPTYYPSGPMTQLVNCSVSYHRLTDDQAWPLHSPPVRHYSLTALDCIESHFDSTPVVGSLPDLSLLASGRWHSKRPPPLDDLAEVTSHLTGSVTVRATAKPQPITRATRKNSSMNPGIPILPLVSSLHLADSGLCVDFEVKEEPEMTCAMNSSTSVVAKYGEDELDWSDLDDLDDTKTPPLIQCSQKETVEAWLAAATRSMNGNTCRQSSQEKQFQFCLQSQEVPERAKSVPEVKERGRKTSILRSQSWGSQEKKNVRFADSLGLKLENVRYYVLSPQVNRRHSCYTPLEDWNNKSNFHYNNPATTTRLVQRYELIAENFSNPCLQLDFSDRLRKQSVVLHSLTAAETTVYGTVAVMNLHFVKRVTIRYTFDEWDNCVEREATYMPGSNDGQTDKFSFVIYAKPQDFKVPGTLATSLYPLKGQSAKLIFAIQLSLGNGHQYWDNNYEKNYCLKLTAC